ncbi:hypothetical protein BDZ88DRAFT_448885 [Geranomyces variabilis]|nr:hypothetical protein BDZ88DRAFT_448885 [Geranomyces variabilis]
MPKDTTKKSSTSSAHAGGKRKPTAYQIYMQKELPIFKEKNPNMAHKDAFRQVAHNWKTSPENPKAQK